MLSALTVPLNFIQSHALRDGALTFSPSRSSPFHGAANVVVVGVLAAEERDTSVGVDGIRMTEGLVFRVRFSSSSIQSSTSRSSAVRDSVRFDSFNAVVPTVDGSTSKSASKAGYRTKKVGNALWQVGNRMGAVVTPNR